MDRTRLAAGCFVVCKHEHKCFSLACLCVESQKATLVKEKKSVGLQNTPPHVNAARVSAGSNQCGARLCVSARAAAVIRCDVFNEPRQFS